MASITLAGLSPIYTENAAAIALDVTAQFDASGLPTNLAGYELTVAISSGALPSDRLTVGEGVVTLDGRIVKVNGQDVATFSGGIGGEDFTVLFGNNADAASVLAVLRSLRYENVSDSLATGDRQVAVSLGVAGQTVVAPVVKTVAVAGVDDLPTVSQTLTLYDGTTGRRPDQSGAAAGGPWLSYIDQFELLGSGSIDAVADANGTVLTTDLAISGGFSNYQAGFGFGNISLTPVNNQFPALDRNLGYTFSFSGQILSEQRSSTANKNNDGKDDRAGFSLLLLSQDQQGIALNFFEDRIWAHEDGSTQSDPSLEPDANPPSDFRTLFTQAEGVGVDTTQLNRYDVVVKDDLYQLSSNGVAILQGKLRDYTGYEPPAVPSPFGDISLPDFNELPSLVFLGDLSPSAGGSTRISEISVSTPDSNPTITVNSGNVLAFPELLLNDLDGDTGATSVTLSVDRGSFAPSSDVNLVLTPTILSGGGGELQLTGTLRDINAYLSDSSRLGYQPDPTFSGAVPIAVTFDQPAISKLDFDLDGFSDLLWYNQATGSTAYWSIQEVSANEGAVSRAFLTDVPLLTDWEIVGTADFNGDGQEDIFWRKYDTFENAVWLMNGDRRETSQFLTTNKKLESPDWRLESAGNFDQDANIEFIWRHAQSGAMALWELNGADFSEAEFLDLTVLNLGVNGGFGNLDWQIAATGDFNGDSVDELIWRNASTGQNAIWTMNGPVLETASFLPSLDAAAWDIVGAADYTRDGKVDLAWRNSVSGANAIWEMDGLSKVSSTFIPQLSSTDWIAVGT